MQGSISLAGTHSAFHSTPYPWLWDFYRLILDIADSFGAHNIISVPDQRNSPFVVVITSKEGRPMADFSVSNIPCPSISWHQLPFIWVQYYSNPILQKPISWWWSFIHSQVPISSPRKNYFWATSPPRMGCFPTLCDVKLQMTLYLHIAMEAIP